MMNRSKSATVAMQMKRWKSFSTSRNADQDGETGKLIPSMADLIAKPVKTPNVVSMVLTVSSNAFCE